MHFWIDKPAGRHSGFGGRRYPATLLPKTCSSQHRRGRCTRPLMVTPVHRFQSLNGTGNPPGPSNVLTARPPRSISRNGYESRFSGDPSQHLQPNNFPNNVGTVGNDRLTLPVINDTSRGLLHFSDFSDAELAGYRLSCGVWITFVLAIGFVAAAKFYFDHQGTGLEVLLFCGLLVTLLLSGCFYSILRRRSRHSHHQESRSQDNPVTVLTATNAIVNENIAPIPTNRQNPPPPYHIAILIPPPDSPEEAPPPAYDKVIR
ncbi:uncharacterized protein LOC105695792 [Orussus abietinus]|uniref:uncharacterized protein LOC105695792 n=1 Tax=Orussus abietinus TaxID=222816 RepID=UPI000625A3C6|nr:uncharacterized protein LOC105695792 [Orussus abietinus]XP_012273136.1 uncharacterized protein LOC105695792 [Orussus abietinus]